jgi:hypothetical protein
LAKELFKDSQIENLGEILKEILKEKAFFLSNKRLKSNTETGAWCQGENSPEKLVEFSIENE